jgi:hypothetical protein
MATRHAAAASYWPAYVDAIINVLLNILFLTTALAVGLSTSEAGRRANTALTAEQAAAAMELAALPDVPRAPAEVPRNKPDEILIARNPATDAASAAHRLSGVKWQVAFSPEAPGLVRLEFDPAVFSLADQQRDDLVAVLRHQGAELGELRWKIWCTADLSGVDGYRLAYLRSMAVREAIIQAGARTDQVSMRIFGGGENRGPEINRVLVSLISSNKGSREESQQ